MKKTTLAFALFLAFSSAFLAQKPVLRDATASPDSVGFSKKGLARIDSFLARVEREGIVPGSVALVARDGKIVFYKASGLRDLEKKEPFERSDIFRIASMTKPVTSVAAMILFEEGHFNLDDPISKWLPEFKNPQVLLAFDREKGESKTEPAKSEITVRQILTHTSGIDYAAISSSDDMKILFAKAQAVPLATDQPIDLAENVRRIATVPLRNHPGERFTYGHNSDVLGRLVEVISGQPLDRFFRERIFKPLGMNDTDFYFSEAKKDRFALVYHEAGQPKRLQKMPSPEGFNQNYPFEGAKKLFMGGAGLSSTAMDYAIFAQMILNGGAYGDARILSRTTIDLMSQNQIGELGMWSPDDRFGLGFGLETARNAAKQPGSEGRIGWSGYFSTHFWIDPKEKIVLVFMKQMAGDNRAWPLADRFNAVVYGALND